LVVDISSVATLWSSHALYATDPALLFDAAEIVDVHPFARSLHPINGFLTLLIAWLILAAGVLIRGI
jgi:hypothetical protein